jgi:pyruvate dehydrogenase E1 component beta subunit
MADNKTLSPDELKEFYILLSRSGALSLAIAKNRGEVFGACLLPIRQESVAMVPMFALLKKGILLESLVSGDHRTQWSAAVAKDVLPVHLDDDHHVREILRNHFGRATGGNYGRDGNIHWGCLECRILHFMYSDMAGMLGTATGWAQEMYRMEWPGLPREKRPIVISFYGEGAEQQGCVHEVRNWIAASNYKYKIEEFIDRYGEEFVTPLVRELKVARGAPIVMVIVKNQYSLFADAIDEYGVANLASRVSKKAYGDMVGVEVNGDDISAYYRECIKAIERAQRCVSTLLVVDTYRGTGHNQDQLKYLSELNAREDLANVESVTGVSDMSEFHEAWKSDPLLYPDYITNNMRFFRLPSPDEEPTEDEVAEKFSQQQEELRDELKSIRIAEEENMLALARDVLGEPEVTVEDDRQNQDLFPPIKWNILPQEPAQSALTPANSIRMNYLTSYNWIVHELLRSDERVTYAGEDSGSGGVLGLTIGARAVAEFKQSEEGEVETIEKWRIERLDTLAKEFGPERIWNAPLSEMAIIETAGGRALSGGKPIAEFQFGWFGQEALKYIKATGIQYYQKKMKFGYISVFPCGIVRSGGSGEYHERYMEADLWPARGVVILFPSNAYDLVGLMRACQYYEGPVAFILEISAASLPEFARVVPLDPYVIPFGKANIVRNGKDFTVIAYGAAAVSAANNTANAISREHGVDVEVIDLRTVYPTDFDAVMTSVQKTGRVAIMQSADEFTGAGHFLRSQLVGRGGVLGDILHYDAIEIVRAGMDGDLVTPSSEALVKARLPYEVTQTGRVMHRSLKLAEVILDGMKYR